MKQESSRPFIVAMLIHLSPFAILLTMMREGDFFYRLTFDFETITALLFNFFVPGLLVLALCSHLLLGKISWPAKANYFIALFVLVLIVSSLQLISSLIDINKSMTTGWGGLVPLILLSMVIPSLLSIYMSTYEIGFVRRS